MDPAADVHLERVTVRDATLISNLLELYIHDMSPMFREITLGEDGRFGYSRLPSYWVEPEARFAYLIKVGASIAGFAFVVREPVAVSSVILNDVAEFFVLRAYRRTGVGRQAAFQLWDAFSGPWKVRVLEENVGALDFWRGAVSSYAGERFTETQVVSPDRTRRILEFSSRSS